MESPFSVFSVVLDLFKSLSDEVKKYQRAKQVRESLFNVLGDKIRTYLVVFEELAIIANKKFLSTLELIKDAPTSFQINTLVDCISDMQLKYAKIIQVFINLAEDCRQVSLNQAFMERLKESNALLYDFVNIMARTVTGKGHIVIDDEFLGFFKLYKGEIYKKIDVGNVDEAVEKLEGFVKIIENKIKPYIGKALIKRKALRRFNESLQELNKVSKRVKTQKITIINLRYFVPSNLLPLVVLIEEAFPVQREKDSFRFQRFT